MNAQQQAADAALSLIVDLFQSFGYIVEPTSGGGACLHFALSDPVEQYTQRLGPLKDFKPSERLTMVGGNFGVKVLEKHINIEEERGRERQKDEKLKEKFELAKLKGTQSEVGRARILVQLAKELGIASGRFIISASSSTVDQYWSFTLSALCLNERQLCEVRVSLEKLPGEDEKEALYSISVVIPDFRDEVAMRKVREILEGVVGKESELPFRLKVQDLLGDESSVDSNNGRWSSWKGRVKGVLATFVTRH